MNLSTGAIIGVGISILILLMLSALFSFSEMALASVNKHKLEQLSNSNTKSQAKKAKKALKFTNTYNETITSIVIMNNIVNILGTTLATVFFSSLFVNNQGLGALISFIVMTLLTIVVGELTPKMLAKKHSLYGVMRLSSTINFVVIIFKPITILIEKVISNSEEVMFESDEDVKIALKESVEGGFMAEHEHRLVSKALDLDETTLNKIMVPKKEVLVLKIGSSRDRIKKIVMENGHTRYPVVNRQGDIVGIFNANFFMKDFIQGKKFSLSRSMFDTRFLLPTDVASSALSSMKINRNKMAIIVSSSDSKKLIGIVTREDIVEEMVGELYDETDREEDGIMKISDDHFVIHWNAKSKDVIEEVWGEQSLKDIKKKDLKFSDFLVSLNDGEKLEGGKHLMYKDSVIWVKNDKKTSRIKLSFEIDKV